MIYKVEATGKPTQLTYEKATWTYNTGKQTYELVATFNIGFPEGLGEEDLKNGQAKLSILIVTGGNSLTPKIKA